MNCSFWESGVGCRVDTDAGIVGAKAHDFILILLIYSRFLSLLSLLSFSRGRTSLRRTFLYVSHIHARVAHTGQEKVGGSKRSKTLRLSVQICGSASSVRCAYIF